MYFLSQLFAINEIIRLRLIKPEHSCELVRFFRQIMNVDGHIPVIVKKQVFGLKGVW